ncbi:hypothetical protein HPMBJEAJ_00396 [Aeromonas phage avDM6]|nr:hypothetical protein HPMBJEAJ_00396 [Aeromonas phage avDM6]
MNYIDDYGVQTEHGTQIGKMITDVITQSVLDKADDIPDGEYGQILTDLFYNMCNKEALMYELHKDYCNIYNVYPEKYKEIPYSPTLRNQIFQIFVCCVNYEFAKYKIIRRSKKREIDEA